MTVKELIAQLNNIENKEAEICRCQDGLYIWMPPAAAGGVLVVGEVIELS